MAVNAVPWYTFPIENASPDDVLLCTGISGLTTAKATLFTGERAGGGGYYQGRRPEKKNVVCTFRLNPDYKLNVEVSDIREILYRLFMEPLGYSEAVRLLFFDDRRALRGLDVYTEAIEVDHFAKDIYASVSMVSTEPYLTGEFPENNSAGTIENAWSDLSLQYEGTADTGIRLEIAVMFDTNVLEIANVHQHTQTMRIEYPMLAGDVVNISTVRGDRYIRINGADRMGALTAASTWITLTQQINGLSVRGADEYTYAGKITEWSYLEQWWGL